MNANTRELLSIKDIYKDFRGLEVLKGVDLTVMRKELGTPLSGPTAPARRPCFTSSPGISTRPAAHIHYNGKRHHAAAHSPTQPSWESADPFQVTNIFSDLTVFDNVLSGVRSQAGRPVQLN